jgi:RNA polymerase sigma-70 factor (ECF subfamily)
MRQDAGFARGLEDEVAGLHDQHAPELLGYARRVANSEETAREAMQEAFLRYFIERTYGREIANPRAWLFQVLRNYIMDRVSALSTQREVAHEDIDRLADLRQNPEMGVEGSQMARELADALSARELECLCLRSEGFSYDEIGAAMRLRPGTVSAMLSRVRDKIRQFSENHRQKGAALAAAVSCLVREAA